MRDVLDEIETLSKDDKQKIMTEYGKSIASYKDKNKILEDENKSLKEKVNEFPDVEQVKKEQFDLGKAEGSKELENYKKSTALQLALDKTKVKDKELLKGLIDNDKISYELKDNNYEVKGLNEQIEEIRKTHDYIFEADKQESKDESRMSTGTEHSENSPSNGFNFGFTHIREKNDK